MKNIQEYAHALVTLSCGCNGYWLAFLEEQRYAPLELQYMSAFEYEESLKAVRALSVIEQAIYHQIGERDLMEEITVGDMRVVASKMWDYKNEYRLYSVDSILNHLFEGVDYNYTYVYTIYKE